MRTSKKIYLIDLRTHRDRGLCKKPSFLTMERKFHRQKIPHRDHKRDAVSVFHQISQSARRVFDTKRRSDSEQPKRHRSDDIGDIARNTERNNELSQKEKLIKNGKIVVDRNNFENSRPWPKSLMEKVEEMLKIEEHHVICLEDITNVEWCPKFVKPEIHGHVRGSRQGFASSQMSRMRAFVSPSSWSPWIKKTVFGVFREME